MKGGLGNLMRQAQQMQETMKKAQAELADLEVTGEAGAGMVGVVFALIWIVEPAWTALLAVPGAVITRALGYIRQLERETRSAVGSLAEVIDPGWALVNLEPFNPDAFIDGILGS